MKKLVPIQSSGNASGVKKSAVSVVVRRNIGLTDADCICATMKPHCPVHSVTNKPIPAPGNDVIR
jgi:hypothetical protein